MRDCITTSTANGALPPNKRLNYTFGMVMGVDDFRQEQEHFEWKHGLSNLLLHGYGTVCGLAVSTGPSDDGADVLVRVAKGYGVSPQGHWIWVDAEQCARLGAWIAQNPPPETLDSPPDSPPGGSTVYVKLCYDECLTDLVPVAGQPCATAEDTRAPARVTEAYQAEFSWIKPAQAAEEGARAFGELMQRVQISGALGSPDSEDDAVLLLEAVENLGLPVDELPPTSPPESPPAPDIFILGAETACATLREALNIWVTLVCPRYQTDGDEDCILLACIDLELDPSGGLILESVVAENCDRPVLAPTRLQQELFCLIGQEGVNDHSLLENLDADDHLQYLRTDGTRPLTGDQSAGGNRITDLAPGVQPGDAVPFEQAIKQGDAAGGDLAGTYPDPGIAALQTRRVIMPAPNANIPTGNVLTWTGTAWVPRPAPGGGPATGDFVLRPPEAGPYAVLAAGIFDENGNPFDGTSPYNGLTATQIDFGRFLLTYPGYSDQIQEFATPIVKGTIVNPLLAEFQRSGLDELLGMEDSVVADSLGDPQVALRLHPFPAQFQVVQFAQQGIVIWITQPVLRPRFIQEIAQGNFDNAALGLLHFTPVAKPFMVEISAYGPRVEEAVAGNAPDGGGRPAPGGGGVRPGPGGGGLTPVPGGGLTPVRGTPVPGGGGLRPGPINLNTATVAELSALPGIGPTLAQRLVEARPQRGFRNMNELLAIRGITDNLLNNLRGRITL